MRNKKQIKTTTNNSVYRKLLKVNAGCPYCPFGRGCNRARSFGGFKSWKYYRITQYYKQKT